MSLDQNLKKLGWSRELIEKTKEAAKKIEDYDLQEAGVSEKTIDLAPSYDSENISFSQDQVTDFKEIKLSLK